MEHMFRVSPQAAMRRVISYEEARDLAVAAVHQMGSGHRDEIGGRYFKENGQSSCLVGNMLEQLGVSRSALMPWNVNAAGISSLSQSGVLIPADEKTYTFLQILQSHNDNGLRWGQAVKNALEYVGDDPTLVDRKPIDFTAERAKVIAYNTLDWLQGLQPNTSTFAVPVTTCAEVQGGVAEHVLAA